MPVTAPSSFGYVAPYFDRPDEADQQGAPEHDNATGNDGDASARNPRDWLSNFEAPSGIAAQIQAQTCPRPQENPNTQAQTRQARIEPSQGYLADLGGIAKSELSVGGKLEMAWNTTKSYWRTSDTAQGATQIANGTLEVAGGLLVSNTGVGAVVGAPLAFHGGDSIGTGINRILNGGDGQTATYKGVKALTGSPDVADAVDRGIPFLGGVAGAGVAVTALTGETAAGGATGAAANSDEIARAGSAADSIYTSMRPMETVFPELKGVNPHYVQDAGLGVNTNCVSCANAAQARLTGADPAAVASPSSGYSVGNDLLPSAPYGLQGETSVATVAQQMATAGDGAVGVVVIKQSGIDHVINVANRGGTVYFIDAQMGKVVTLKPSLTVKLGTP